MIAAAGTGLTAGPLYANTMFIQPREAFSISWAAAMSFMVVLGGLGTVAGPIAGALVYVLLTQLLSEHGALSLIVLGVVTVATMLFFPHGLVGALERRFGVELFRTRRVLAAAPGSPPP